MRAKAVIHSVLLASAAKRILLPAGLFQKGRSRTWLADQVWWMAVVEFQPSDWSQGSYLNVGCMWLWNTKQHISFDVGYRVNGFLPFENEEQFGPVADKLAVSALERVEEYRTLFRCIHDVSDYYFQKPRTVSGRALTQLSRTLLLDGQRPVHESSLPVLTALMTTQCG
jgi:hypothetical protein